MANPPLIIILHGLIALVPTNGPTGPINEMTALLVDARNPPIQQCLSMHLPKLEVLTSKDECEDAGCTKVASCTCEAGALERRAISFEITPDIPTTEFHPRQIPPPGLLTETPDPRAAADFAYVPNMSASPVGRTVNPNVLGPQPPPELFARMRFPFSTVSACSLAKREDGGAWFVHSLAFRQIGSSGTGGERHQPMAQVLLAKVELPQTAIEGQRVVLVLRDLRNGAEKRMMLQRSDDGYLVKLSNETVELKRDAPCDDGLARHFAFFYNLTASPPAWKDRLIPYVKNTRFALAEHLLSAQCDLVHSNFHPMERPVCPMASFDPLN